MIGFVYIKIEIKTLFHVLQPFKGVFFFHFFRVEEIEALMAEGQKEEVFVPQLHAQSKFGN